MYPLGNWYLTCLIMQSVNQIFKSQNNLFPCGNHWWLGQNQNQDHYHLVNKSFFTACFWQCENLGNSRIQKLFIKIVTFSKVKIKSYIQFQSSEITAKVFFKRGENYHSHLSELMFSKNYWYVDLSGVVSDQSTPSSLRHLIIWLSGVTLSLKIWLSDCLLSWLSCCVLTSRTNVLIIPPSCQGGILLKRVLRRKSSTQYTKLQYGIKLYSQTQRI